MRPVRTNEAHNSIMHLFLFIFFLALLFLAAFDKIFRQKHDVDNEERKIHKRRGIGGEQYAVYDEHDAAHHIDDARLDLVAR